MSREAASTPGWCGPGAGAITALVSPLARAQDYPNKAINSVVPLPPDGSNDMLAKIDATLARRITEAEDVQTLWYLRSDSSRLQGRLSGRMSTRRSPLARC